MEMTEVNLFVFKLLKFSTNFENWRKETGVSETHMELYRNYFTNKFVGSASLKTKSYALDALKWMQNQPFIVAKTDILSTSMGPDKQLEYHIKNYLGQPLKLGHPKALKITLLDNLDQQVELSLDIVTLDQSGTAFKVNFTDLFPRMELKSYLLEFWFAQPPAAEGQKLTKNLLYCSKGFRVKS